MDGHVGYDTRPSHRGRGVAVLLWTLPFEFEGEEHGLETVQKIASYHDEPLTGKLQGLRSIRLSGAYRAYYRIVREKVECVFVEEVNKHDYKAIERLFGA
jgi:proteic killer suppression protein